MLFDQCLFNSLTGVLQSCVFIKPKATFDLHLFIYLFIYLFVHGLLKALSVSHIVSTDSLAMNN